MGRKQQWFKAWSYEALADEKLKSLSFYDQGVFWCVINFLRTQTDTPGYFIIGGAVLDLPQIALHLKRYAKPETGKAAHRNCQRDLKRSLVKILAVGLLKEIEFGREYDASMTPLGRQYDASMTPTASQNELVVCSPRIVKEYEEYENKRRAGKIRYYGRGDRRGDLEEKRRERYSRNGPRSHFRTDPESVPDAPTLGDFLREQEGEKKSRDGGQELPDLAKKGG